MKKNVALVFLAVLVVAMGIALYSQIHPVDAQAAVTPENCDCTFTQAGDEKTGQIIRMFHCYCGNLECVTTATGVSCAKR